MRSLLLVFLLVLISSGLRATTGGPGNPTDSLLNEVAGDLPPSGPALLDAPVSELERAALAAAFAPPAPDTFPPILDDITWQDALRWALPHFGGSGDDLRSLAGITSDARGKVDSARAFIQTVSDSARQIKNLVDAQLANLPLGITIPFGDVKIKIAIAEARLLPTHAEVDIYLAVDFPNEVNDPIFVVEGAKWSRKGGLEKDVNLKLIADWGIDFKASKGRLIFRKTEVGQYDPNPTGTFMRMGCDGFSRGQIDATMVLSRDWVIPFRNGVAQTDSVLKINAFAEDPPAGSTGDLFTPTTAVNQATEFDNWVHADFNLFVEPGEGMLFQAGVEDEFAFTGFEDVVVSLENVALDLSETVNPQGMEANLPPNFHSPHLPAGQLLPTWTGFYMTGMSVRLPEQWSAEGNPPITIASPYMIVDKEGITAHIYALDVLPLNEGNLDGWAFGVDSVDFKVTVGQFESAALAGHVNVPLLKGVATCDAGDDAPTVKDDCLRYVATVQSGNRYYFGMAPMRDFCVPLWKAEARIDRSSNLLIAYETGDFSVTARLYGDISIDDNVTPAVHLKLDSLPFSNVVLTTADPYFETGTWGMPKVAEADFQAFKLNLEGIRMVEKDSVNEDGLATSALFFDAVLTVDEDIDLEVRGSFQMAGVLNEGSDGRQRWKYRDLRVNAFSVDGGNEAFHVGAAVAFYRGHDDWGTGFYGRGQLELTALSEDADAPVGIEAVAQFGNKDLPGGTNHKYFFVDVMGKFGSGIPVVGLSLMAAGGGVYKGMSRNDSDLNTFVDTDPPLLAEADTEIASATENKAPLPNSIIGRSTSGMSYSVDPENKWGAFLQVVIAGNKPDAFSVNGRLEIQVQHGGSWSAGIEGNVMIMGPVNYDNDMRIDEGIGIFVRMAYVHNSEDEGYRGFVATADAFVNINDGQLVGAAGLAPTDVIPPGTPGNPPGRPRSDYVSTSINYAGGVNMEFSNRTWHIHIGYPPLSYNDVDGRIAVKVDLYLAEATARAYFCIGHNVPPVPPLPQRVVSIAGDLNMTRDFSQYINAAGFAFGASLELGADGTFGPFYYDFAAGAGFDINVRNYGNAYCAGDASGDRIGLNGWYAAGQAYAYVEGTVGMNIRLFFRKRRVELMHAGVAAVLQVRAPNPFWARGSISGRYRVLGLISGNFRVEAEFGKRCIIQGPNGADPFETLELVIATNPEDEAEDVSVDVIPTGYTMLMIDESENFGDHNYKLILHYAELRNVATGELVPGTFPRDSAASSVEFIPDAFLDGMTEYELKIKVELKKQTNGSGSFSHLKFERKYVKFTTGEAPVFINESNIAYSYPIAGQANFYEGEHDKGYLKLTRAQSALPEELNVEFKPSSGGGYRLARATYNPGTQEYEYDMPNLSSRKIYRLRFRTIGTGGGGGGNPGPGTTPDQQQQQQLPGSLDALGVVLPDLTTTIAPAETVYEMYFRTSMYGTLEEKVNAMIGSADFESRDSSFYATGFGMEAVDTLEMFGHPSMEVPLITAEVTDGQAFLDRTNLNNLLQSAGFGHLVGEGLTYASMQPAENRGISLVGVQQYDEDNVTGLSAGLRLSVPYAKSMLIMADNVADTIYTDIIEVIDQAQWDWGMAQGYNEDDGPEPYTDCPLRFSRSSWNASDIGNNYCGFYQREEIDFVVEINELKDRDDLYGGITLPVRISYNLPGGRTASSFILNAELTD